MAEYFEVVLFENGVKTTEENLELIKNIFTPLLSADFLSRYCKIYDGDEKIEYIRYECNNWTEYEINIPNFLITEETFKEQILSFLTYIDVCFKRIPTLLFATGMYELTYDQIAHLKDIHMIECETIRKFPIVFFRKNEMGKYGYAAALVEYNDTVCCFNGEGAQHIFYENER